jgi:hypothetical protein
MPGRRHQRSLISRPSPSPFSLEGICSSGRFSPFLLSLPLRLDQRRAPVALGSDAELISHVSCPFFLISRVTVLSKSNLRISARSVFPIASGWIGESEVAPAVAAFSATHLAFLFASQFGGQISVAHVRVPFGSGVALGPRIESHGLNLGAES